MTPPTTILAPVDFSPASAVALGLAGRLAAHTGAGLRVLYVEHPLLVASALEQGLDIVAEDRAGLARWVTDALPPGSPAPALDVVVGGPAGAILAQAAASGADLIVMGSHGLTAAARLVFGSTTQRTLRRAPVSVLVVPEAWTPPRPEAGDMAGAGPVVAGVDFSAASVAAAGAACRLAAALGTDVELVHAVPRLRVPATWSAGAEAVLLARVAEARARLDEVARSLPGTVPLRLRVTDGSPAEVLADAARTGDGRHPLLVLGRAGEDGAPEPGAVAYQTLARAGVPVLLYAPGQAEAAK